MNKEKPTLKEVQDWFKWRVADQQMGVPAANEYPSDSELISYRPLANPQFDTLARLGTYSYAYLARLQDALAEDYQAVKKIIGSDAWSEISKQYFTQFPSSSFTLTDAGRFFPNFLSESKILVEYPFLGDLAKFEWAMVEAFYARELPPISPEQLELLTQISPELVKVGLDSSVSLLQSPYPIDLIFESELPPPPTEPARDTFLLVYRQGDQPKYNALLAYQFRILRNFQMGRSLEEAIQHSALNDLSPSTVERDFQLWMSQGLIRSISLSN